MKNNLIIFDREELIDLVNQIISEDNDLIICKEGVGRLSTKIVDRVMKFIAKGGRKEFEDDPVHSDLEDFSEAIDSQAKEQYMRDVIDKG